MKPLMRLFLFVLLFSAIMVIVSFGQDVPKADPAPSFPFLLLIPYVLGVLAHWLKKYTIEGMGATLWQWLFKNFGWSITSLVAGIVAVWGIYTANPSALVAGNLGSWIIVFTTAMAADTLNQPPK